MKVAEVWLSAGFAVGEEVGVWLKNLYKKRRNNMESEKPCPGTKHETTLPWKHRPSRWRWRSIITSAKVQDHSPPDNFAFVFASALFSIQRPTSVSRGLDLVGPRYRTLHMPDTQSPMEHEDSINSQDPSGQKDGIVKNRRPASEKTPEGLELWI